MTNAAHEFASILELWRSKTENIPTILLQAAADDLELTSVALLEHAANLAHQVNQMYGELEQAGVPVEYFEEAKSAWMQAPFLYGIGWVKSNTKIGADHIIKSHDLALLKAFADQYDYASKTRKPNPAVIESFVTELEPIAEFIRSLDIAEETKTLILRKIENARILLRQDGVSLDVILTKLGEILGLLVILAGSSATDDETAERLWDKVKYFGAKFGQDVSSNVFAGAITSVGLGALGM